MLVLTRKIKEEIRIGDNITVTILKVRGQIVRVGIDAPKDVRIMRSELTQAEQTTGDAGSEGGESQEDGTREAGLDQVETAMLRAAPCLPPLDRTAPCCPDSVGSCASSHTGMSAGLSAPRPLGNALLRRRVGS